VQVPFDGQNLYPGYVMRCAKGTRRARWKRFHIT
jgi:hypothetical protein